jgi:putative endonuclease
MDSKVTPDGLRLKKTRRPTSKELGDKGETTALSFLMANGLYLVQKNYKTPGRGGGEIDLIMRDADNTLIFVEVKKRQSRLHGGAASSITLIKQKRICKAALIYLSHFTSLPACRFDVVLIEPSITWIKAAFYLNEPENTFDF